MRRWMTLMLLFAAALMAQTAAADMIRGLDRLPVISMEEIAQLPDVEGGVVLTAGGVRLPYDAGENRYLIPQSGHTRRFDGVVSLEKKEGYTYYVTAGGDYKKRDAIDQSAGFMVIGVSPDGTSCDASGVVMTSLPVIMIETEHGRLPGEADERGFLSVFDVSSGAIRARQTPMEINLRGNTSKDLPKQSYRVKIVDEQGNKRNMDLAGLRSDDDWIFNPLYTDTSKVREKLAYELWAQINSSGQRAASSRLEYAELYIDGAYWGLYGVQERIDRKQVDADKQYGMLYKVFANWWPEVEQLLACGQEEEICEGFEIKFAGESVESVWEPAATYMSLLEGSENAANASVSLENVIDYGLWAMLLQAHDCHFKNQFIHCSYEGDGYVMYKIPWDLNHTFGDCWSTEAVEQNNTRYYVGEMVVDDIFERLILSENEAVYDMIESRWKQLRAGGVTQENIMARAQEIFDTIYPALCRDDARWPQCGMGEGNARSLRDIEVSVADVLPKIDAFVEGLGSEDLSKLLHEE